MIWLLFSVAEAAQKRGISIPIIDTSGGGEIDLTFKDVLQMKIMWAITLGGFFFIQIWNWYRDRNDKTVEVLESLVKTVNRLEEKVDHLEKYQVGESDVKRLAREEIEFVERIRGESQNN